MLRLWSLLNPGSAPSLRFSVCLSLLCLLLWVSVDWFFARPEPQFFSDNLPLLAWYALAILTLTALLRWKRPAPGFDAAFALSVGLVPVALLLEAGVAPYLSPPGMIAARLGTGLYALCFLARGMRFLTGYSLRFRALAGIVFIVGFIWLTDVLDVIPDLWAPPELQAPLASTDETLADQESILFGQSARIDQALAAIEPATTTKSRAFFLGFAGVGEEKVFAQEIALAARVLGEQYGIGVRAVSLINDERDLESAPLASVSALKYALRGLAARMNVDRDVLFLSISSHGSEDPLIAVSNSQLPFDDLGPETLAAALNDSGIKWKVVIISACYAGAFIEALKSPDTIVIAAAAPDRTSFGCGSDSDLTYFGEAFYRDALPGSHSLRAAFDKAKTAIAARERRENVDASKPMAYFGPDMESRLASISSLAP
jgi:Peptidase C13 family